MGRLEDLAQPKAGSCSPFENSSPRGADEWRRFCRGGPATFVGRGDQLEDLDRVRPGLVLSDPITFGETFDHARVQGSASDDGDDGIALVSIPALAAGERGAEGQGNPQGNPRTFRSPGGGLKSP